MPAQKVSKAKVKAAISSLKKLPAKEKQFFGLREAIYEMRKELEALLKRGYTYEEVANILSDHEIKIKGVTLKQYLNSFRKKTTKSAKALDTDATGDTDIGGAQSSESVEDQGQEKTRTKPGSGDGFVDIPDDL